MLSTSNVSLLDFINVLVLIVVEKLIWTKWIRIQAHGSFDYLLKYFIPTFKETIAQQKLTLCLRVAFVNVTEDCLSCIVHLAQCLCRVIKFALFALKQKSVSLHNTLNNLPWGMFLYKVEGWNWSSCGLSVYIVNTLYDWLIVHNCPKSVDSRKIFWLIIVTFSLVEKYLKESS